MPRVYGNSPGGAASGPASGARYTGLSSRPESLTTPSPWGFDKLRQHSTQGPRMHEGHPGAVDSCPHLTRHLGAQPPEPLELAVQVLDLEGHVVHPGAVPGKEAAER